MDYQTFLESKIQIDVEHGGERFAGSPLHESTKPHQADAIRWALRQGRALVAMSFGLGKTHIQIELLRLIHEMTGQKVLVICPLGVKHQFQHEDGPRLGVRFEYVRTDDEVEAASTPGAGTAYLITNYERVRDGGIDPRRHNFACVSLDEGSVLRNLGSKTYQTFQTLMKDVPYRFVCTATPSPNRYRELIYYAQYLGIMDAGQALTRWFKRNPEKAGDLQLHPQHERDFWMWVASWALFLYKPSDLGYDDTGYDVPPLRVHYHRLDVDHARAWSQMDNYGQRRLLLDAASSATAAVKEKRATLADRVAEAKRIIADAPEEHYLIWHHLEDERRALEHDVPEVTTVYGSQDLEVREQRILDFSHGKIKSLATKPEIAGSGCNFQRYCHTNIFLGVDYKFEDFIQAVHRTQRFQQPSPVDVHIIYAESEDHVIEVLKQKWQQHDALTARMREIVQSYGLSHAALRKDLKRSIGVERIEVKGELYTAINNDCVKEVATMADGSIGLIHTSIPFGNHYEYTTKLEDFGHNPSDEDFFKQMDYLIPQLLRVLKPGRCAAIHVKDRILYGHQTASGFMAVAPFSDQTVAAFMKHGFLYEGRRTIVTDVVRENNSTYRLGWSEMCKDASKMGSGLPEYLLLFRKPPMDNQNQYADEPVTKSKDDFSRGRWQVDAHALWRSNGNRHLLPDELARMENADVMFADEQLHSPYDYARHIALCEARDEAGGLPSTFMLFPPKVTKDEAGPVWDDVVTMRTLNSEQARKREVNHICPLPFDIVERAIRLYSNAGDVVLDPFGGLMTVPYTAVKLRRYGIGVELNAEYFRNGVRYLNDIEVQMLSPTLFDVLEIDGAAVR